MNKSLDQWDRREFLGRMALASAAGLIGLRPGRADAEPPPETTKLTLFENPVICLAPNYVAKELLHSEGFTDVRYRNYPTSAEGLLSGEVDLTVSFVPPDLVHIDAGEPLVILAGSHIGCTEVVTSNRVGSVRDLKGKSVAVEWFRGADHIFISMFAAYVGLDPQKDINWVIHPRVDRAGLLAEGKIDAFMAGPPWSLELRAKKIGHVLVNTTTDKPWSQYFCCVVASTKAFVGKHPVATKRALRALMKATDLCALEPNRVARLIADRGLSPSEDYTRQMLKEIPYGKWREYNPEDSVRFFALWMREAGMIKSSPQRIIAEGTDWRFLNELKRELKA
jgi:NitT/TauT family transport system substrate-binding protein